MQESRATFQHLPRTPHILQNSPVGVSEEVWSGCVTHLLVSHSFTRLSREPETSWCSCDGAHLTAVTQPVWEVRDSSTKEPSGGGGAGKC